jgi:phosphate transport system substrate-binding protein
MKNICLLIAAISLLWSACQPAVPTLRIKGSDTEVNLAAQLAEHFYQHNPTRQVSVSGGGSGLGIAALLNGTADLANASRSISADEMALFRAKGLALDSFVFAQDAVAFVVAASLPIDSIALPDLARVLDGTIPDWQPLTGRSLPVNLYGRQSNSGTYEYVRHKLGIDFSRQAKEMNGNAQILEAVRVDLSGIGYVGAGYVVKGGVEGIKVLRLADRPGQRAISPFDTAALTQGAYFFQRPLLQYFRVDDREKVRAFLDFEQSEAGRQLVKAAGYYPPK